MLEYLSHNAPSIVATIAIIVTATLHYFKTKKTDEDKDDKMLISLSVGQGKIFTELKNINNTIVNLRKENDVLFDHKDDCLKRRPKCDEKFLAKDDHDRLHP